MGTSRSCSGLRLHRVLVDRSSAIYVVVEGGAGGHKVVLRFLVTLGTGPNLNSGRIDALLLDQVVLRVDGALCSQRVGLLLCRGRLANHYRRGIGLLLQVESDVIEASLRLVVDPGRTLLIAIEIDRAKRLGLRSRRRRRCFDAHAGGRGRRLTLVILHRASNGDGASRCTGGAQGGGIATAADLAGGRAIR